MSNSPSRILGIGTSMNRRVSYEVYCVNEGHKVECDDCGRMMEPGIIFRRLMRGRVRRPVCGLCSRFRFGPGMYQERYAGEGDPAYGP